MVIYVQHPQFNWCRFHITNSLLQWESAFNQQHFETPNKYNLKYNGLISVTKKNVSIIFINVFSG